MNSNLFPRYLDIVKSLSGQDLRRDVLPDQLLIEREGPLSIYYAPFDYVNEHAKIVLVGITPGRQQMINALIEANRLLSAGEEPQSVR